MSNPNPFVPKGSLLERQTQSRSRLKLGVSCVLAVSIIGLVAMLIQGCKRAPDADTANSSTLTDTNPAPADISTNPVADTNAPAPMPAGTNAPVAYTPPTPPPAPVPVPTPVVDNTASAGSEYVVQSGDTLGKIAKHNGISLKALEAANPGVDSKHLKVKQKLVIPGGTGGSAATSGAVDNSAGAGDSSDVELYTVKTGDTLSKIAKAHGSTIKAIEAANNLSTTKINVGKKLKIPRKASAVAAPAAPVDNTPPAPTVPPASVNVPPSAPTPTAPAPAGNPN